MPRETGLELVLSSGHVEWKQEAWGQRHKPGRVPPKPLTLSLHPSSLSVSLFPRPSATDRSLLVLFQTGHPRELGDICIDVVRIRRVCGVDACVFVLFPVSVLLAGVVVQPTNSLAL